MVSWICAIRGSSHSQSFNELFAKRVCAPLQDKDVSGMLTRTQLEEMCESRGLFSKMSDTCERALKMSGLTAEGIDCIEVHNAMCCHMVLLNVGDCTNS